MNIFLIEVKVENLIWLKSCSWNQMGRSSLASESTNDIFTPTVDTCSIKTTRWWQLLWKVWESGGMSSLNQPSLITMDTKEVLPRDREEVTAKYRGKLSYTGESFIRVSSAEVLEGSPVNWPGKAYSLPDSFDLKTFSWSIMATDLKLSLYKIGIDTGSVL